jgi:cytochrome c oxidase cbb3-type subunit 3
MRRLVAIVPTLLLVAACHDEARRYREPATASESRLGQATDTVNPGPTPAAGSPDAGPSTPIRETTYHSPYEDNAWAVSEGKRLFEWMNCSGCHAHGGGAMGPALMDGAWRYGNGDPGSIFASIVEGRPGGMPAYRDRIGEADVWKLVAYVRTLSGRGNHVAAGGRNDSMRYKKAESLKDEEK